jgi:hypothetical protein
VGVAAGRNKDWAIHEFIQIGTAYTAPSYIYANKSWFYGRFADIFEPDITFVIKTSSFHLSRELPDLDSFANFLLLQLGYIVVQPPLMASILNSFEYFS